MILLLTIGCLLSNACTLTKPRPQFKSNIIGFSPETCEWFLPTRGAAYSAFSGLSCRLWSFSRGHSASRACTCGIDDCCRLYNPRSRASSHSSIRPQTSFPQIMWQMTPDNSLDNSSNIKKGKAFPYLTPSVGPGADPGVQAVSLQVTVSHPPGGRLPLLSAGPAVTSPVAEHHHPLAGTKLYCLVTDAHRANNLPKVVTQRCLEQDLNPRPTDRKPKCLA